MHQDLETLTFSYITESQAKPRLVPISQRPTATCSTFQPAQVIYKLYDVTFEMQSFAAHDLYIRQSMTFHLKGTLLCKYQLCIIEIL